MNDAPLGRTAAEQIAIQALGWLAQDHERLPGFMAATGAAPDTLRSAAAQPAFLGAVLDFILSDDANVIAFCDAAGLPYTHPMRARAALPGGDLPHWT